MNCFDRIISFLVKYSFVVALILVSAGCKDKKVVQNKISTPLVDREEKGAPLAETLILMHNRMGIRLEYNLDKETIELWISPQAGKSLSYKDRNFSNRDDFTRLFDKISLPGLKLEDFVKCDYDAFHSVIHFKNQRVHIANIFSQPMIVIWCEKAQEVDFKSDKSDNINEKGDKIFAIDHEDRGKRFQYVATLGQGSGSFDHQRDVDEGRSIFARARLSPIQPLFIAGELSKENIKNLAKKVASDPLHELLTINNAEIENALDKGVIRLKNMPELQKLLDVNKRIFLSMQDASGAFRASIQNIYYLIWVRDGGIASPALAYSGWSDPLDKWNQFQLANPTTTNYEPKGKFFGQLVDGKITKWEEDGLFYVISSAFTYWTQMGDKKYISGANLQLLESTMTWLEKYCYDDSLKAFGRYHYSETPLAFSRGYGWDDAVGKPSPKWASVYKGDTIVRAYDAYMNMCAYATYNMLAIANTGAKSQEYIDKANGLMPILARFMANKGKLPSYGLLKTSKGAMIEAEPYGMDNENYLYAYTLPNFYPDMSRISEIRNNLFEDMMAKPSKYFLSTWFALLTSLDTEFIDESKLIKAVNYAAKQCYQGGKYLPMPYTMKEMTDVKDGDPYHDIRPQAFTIGPWMSAMSNFGVKRLPFGLALRSTQVLDELVNYQYKNALIDFYFIGAGKVEMVKINGKPIYNSLQIPEKDLSKGDNVIEINMSTKAPTNPTLVSSNVTLQSLNGDSLSYVFEGYGKNYLTFKNTSGKFSASDGSKPVDLKVSQKDNYQIVEFEGRGNFALQILK
ncbi:MAG TPA: hypothetical protein VF691_05875 [Cytophagaceae bacterium]|jgi:hypothetical protein